MQANRVNVWLGLLGIQWLFRNVALNDRRLLNLLGGFVDDPRRNLNPTNRVRIGRSCFTFSIVVRCFSSTIIETIGSLVGNSISILINSITLINWRPGVVNTWQHCRRGTCKPLFCRDIYKGSAIVKINKRPNAIGSHWSIRQKIVRVLRVARLYKKTRGRITHSGIWRVNAHIKSGNV